MAEAEKQMPQLTEVGIGTDRHAKFVRLAENRTRKALKAIRVIGNLANRSQYEYSDADVKKIVAALNAEVDALRNRLSDADRRRGVEFKL